MTRHYIGRIVPSIHHVFYELSLEQIQPTCTSIDDTLPYTSLFFLRSCRISDFSALVNRVFVKFRPRCQVLFSSKGESHCYSGWTTTPKAKTHGKHSQSPGLPAIPTSQQFFFAFWRISENPKQLPKCHDDSWSIDVSSWFSHGKIVEDICRTWVEA